MTPDAAQEACAICYAHGPCEPNEPCGPGCLLCREIREALTLAFTAGRAEGQGERERQSTLLEELGTLLRECEHYRYRSAVHNQEWERIYDIYHLLTGKHLSVYT